MASLLLFQKFALWYSMDTTLSNLISFSVHWQLNSCMCEHILCLLSPSSSEGTQCYQVLSLRIVLAHEGCALACFLRHSYLLQGFQLHIHTLDGWEILLFSTGIWHKKKQLIGFSKILTEMIYHIKLPAEMGTPVVLVTPSYPRVLQNTLMHSL